MIAFRTNDIKCTSRHLASGHRAAGRIESGKRSVGTTARPSSVRPSVGEEPEGFPSMPCAIPPVSITLRSVIQFDCTNMQCDKVK